MLHILVGAMSGEFISSVVSMWRFQEGESSITGAEYEPIDARNGFLTNPFTQVRLSMTVWTIMTKGIFFLWLQTLHPWNLAVLELWSNTQPSVSSVIFVNHPPPLIRGWGGWSLQQSQSRWRSTPWTDHETITHSGEPLGVSNQPFEHFYGPWWEGGVRRWRSWGQHPCAAPLDHWF